MDKTIVEYDYFKGVFSGPYGTAILWVIGSDDEDRAIDEDWHQTETILEWVDDRIETTECIYVPYNEDEEIDVNI